MERSISKLAFVPLGMAALCGLVLSASSAAGERTPVAYVIPGSHLDLGFTAPPSEIRAQRIRILDEAIDVAESDPAFVWFEEAGWVAEIWLDHYHDNRGQIERLRKLVLEGRIGIGATMLSAHAAAFPEGLPLLTMHLDRVESELGRRPDVAIVNDVPAVLSSFRDALAERGVTRLLVGRSSEFAYPLPPAMSRRPFRWMSHDGRHVDVFVDPDHFTAGAEVWGLPPKCGRVFEPERFGIHSTDEEVFARGAAAGLERMPKGANSTVVQHSFDNWDTECAQLLPAAVLHWNSSVESVHLRLAQPSAYFDALVSPPILRGEWATDWDFIRASDPVWTWRLREAMRHVDETTPRQARRLLVEVMDHNVGLGPRWKPDSPMWEGLRHVSDVERLYRRAVESVLGVQGARALPAALPTPASVPWPDAWRRYVGEQSQVARVRAGNPPLQNMVNSNDLTLPLTVRVEADARRLVASARIDRVAIEKQIGPRYRAVLEVAIRQPISALSLALVGNDEADQGWLSGHMPTSIVAPEGVVVRGPQGMALRARGPLVLAWGLQADLHDPSLTWLQALAVSNATHADVGHQEVLLPYDRLYPGEPAVFACEIEVEQLD